MNRRSSRLYALLLAAAAGLALAGIALVVTYFLLRERPDRTLLSPPDPWVAETFDAVSPALALRPMAGEMPAVTVQAALSVADPDTAGAVLIHSPEISDPERTGRLLLLADRYAADDQRTMASACLQQIQLLIALSPQLSDVARADAALQSAAHWTAMGQDSKATASLDQAVVVAQHSVWLRPAQREALWLDLAEAYSAVGEETKAEAARSAATRRGQFTTAEAAPLALPLFTGEAPIPAEVSELQAARQERVVRLIEEWIAVEGVDVGPEAADLEEFLRREDSARQAFFDGQTGSGTELGVQAATAWAQARWQTLKYRVATQVYGLSLVSEWETDRAQIRLELNKSYELLFGLYGDQATALPTAADVDRAWLEVLRQEVLWGELQLYPDFPRDQLVERMTEVQDKVRSAAEIGIWVSVQSEDGVNTYRLEGSASP